jgi:hypothetical protein
VGDQEWGKEQILGSEEDQSTFIYTYEDSIIPAKY